MAKTTQNSAKFSRKLYEKLSFTHYFKIKKGKWLKSQHQELLDSCKSNLQKSFNTHQLNDHQQKVYKKYAEEVLENCVPPSCC